MTAMDAGGATYQYDGEGRRMKKIGNELTFTFYGPGGIISEFTTTSGRAQASTNDTTSYLHWWRDWRSRL